GSNRAFRWVRRLYRPFVSHYVAVSSDLVRYLSEIGIPPERVEEICNGVDARRFHPSAAGREPIEGCAFGTPDHWLVGTVGRMQPIKDQLTLANAFIRALDIAPELRQRLRLVIVGDGPLYREVHDLLARTGLSALAWMPGTRTAL